MQWFLLAPILVLGVVNCLAVDGGKVDSRKYSDDDYPPRFSPPDNWRYNTSYVIEPKKINVHIVPHSHDDTGWQITVDQYYYSRVYYIIESLVDALVKNKDRKFIFVEVAFFARWYEEQTPERKQTVKKLVGEKQLEFINGGWCMHDEASPFYIEMIDQTTRGHQFIKREFGVDAAPRGAWQIDPFGHSNTQAWLLSAQAGMESLFWGRTDYQDMECRLKSPHKGLEWIWEGSESLGASARVFAGGLFGTGDGGYSCPINFDSLSGKQVQDNPNRYDYNLESWLDTIVSAAIKQDKYTAGNHQMWACGNDFAYTNANSWFHNLDKLIHYAKLDGRVNFVYSTPTKYVDEKKKLNLVWEIRRDDIFPLSDRPHQYWTGYFTSRPALKRQVRMASNLLNTARQLEVLSSVDTEDFETRPFKPCPRVGTSWTDAFEGAIGVATHHDGMSGTARQSVTNDYAQRITDAQIQVEAGISEALAVIVGDEQFYLCRDLNISLCNITSDGKDFRVIAWNPLSRGTNQTLRIPMDIKGNERVNVYCGSQKISSQLIELNERTLKIPSLYLNSYNLSEDELSAAKLELENKATHVLTFTAELPAIGFAKFDVHRTESGIAAEQQNSVRSQKYTFNNGLYEIKLDSRTNKVSSIRNMLNDLETNFSISWGWYESSTGGCTEGFGCDVQKSGAYMFRPNSSAFLYPGVEEEVLRTDIIEGEIVTEIHQYFSEWVSHVIRLVKDAPYIEIEYTVGPIPMNNPWIADPEKRKTNLGKEMVVRYKTSLKSFKTFYTDSNGREMIKRERNERAGSYPKLNVSEPIAGNYYPVNGIISLDEVNTAQFSVITDVSQGGSSINDGELELMVHRRLFADDYRGVQEPLNETMCGCNDLGARPGSMGTHDNCWCEGLTIRGSHYLIFDEPKMANKQRRLTLDEVYFKPLLAFAPLRLGESASGNSRYSALTRELPPNVNLVTLTSNYADFNDDTVLLRFAHSYSFDEHPTLSKPVKISLKDLFAKESRIRVISAEETSLTANQPYQNILKSRWNMDNSQASGLRGSVLKSEFDEKELTFLLRPMEVRSFLCKLVKTNAVLDQEDLQAQS